MMKEMLSIVVPTYGRTTELKNLLDSIIVPQNYDFEIIIVDQNVTNILDSIIKEHHFNDKIIHLKCELKGASYARNMGVKMSTGLYLCFPDDDACFKDNTVERALDLINKNNIDVVFGKCIDSDGNDSVLKWNTKAEFLNTKNLGNNFVEATMFVKSKVFDNVRYDENLGVGTFHGSGEVYDLVIKLLGYKYILFYDPEIIFYHPNKVIDYSSVASIRRVFSYSCGFSSMCIKNSLYYKLYKRLLLVMLYLPITLIFFNKRTRYYLAEILGILSGLIVR